MTPFTRHSGVLAPLDRANVDTDAIIPARFLTAIGRSGFGPHLFDDWRYLDRGMPGMDCSARPLNPAFVLNHAAYEGATVLLARGNFGCGSSREHAVWALQEHGFRAVIAPSFGDIFYQNSLRNGLLPVALDDSAVEQLFARLKSGAAWRVTIDLHEQSVRLHGAELHYRFDFEAERKQCLLHGLDDVALTLRQTDDIRAFQSRHWARFPWLEQEI